MTTVCGWCGKVRNPDGTWEPLPGLVGGQAISTGICPDCGARLEADLDPPGSGARASGPESPNGGVAFAPKLGVDYPGHWPYSVPSKQDPAGETGQRQGARMNTTDRNDKIARRIELESRPAPTTQAEALMDLSDVRELYLDRGGFPAEGDRIRDLVDGLRNRGWSAGPVADALREIAKTVNVTWYTASRRIELAADAIEH